MKIVRINKGKTVNLPIQFVVLILMTIITIKLMNVFAEPLSIVIAIAISPFLPAIWFACNVIIINEENKTLYDGVWTMGYRLNKSIKYNSIEKIYINKVKTKQTMYSLSNQQNIIVEYEYRVYLKLDSGDKHFLLSHPLEEKVEEKIVKIKEKLKLF